MILVVPCIYCIYKILYIPYIQNRPDQPYREQGWKKSGGNLSDFRRVLGNVLIPDVQVSEYSIETSFLYILYSIYRGSPLPLHPRWVQGVPSW